jgi:hypothetical protein
MVAMSLIYALLVNEITHSYSTNLKKLSVKRVSHLLNVTHQMGLVHFSLAHHENLWGYLLHLVACNSVNKK